MSEVVPITVSRAKDWIRHVHRHLPDIQGGLFAVGVEVDGKLVGVALAGNPPRVWQGTGRVVISRVAVVPDLPKIKGSDGRIHASPVCTTLYGRICQAARALGYSEVWTYTLPGEDGRSIRAAGFRYMGETKAEIWDRPSRRRSTTVPALKKGRWLRSLK